MENENKTPPVRDAEDPSVRSPHFERIASVFMMEAVAAARNAVAALQAKNEGRLDESRLFRAICRAQNVHWRKALMLLRGKLSSTDDNLSIGARMIEQSIEAYKRLMEDTEGPAKGLADQFLRTAKNHLGLVGRISTAEGKVYHVCGICGFIAADRAPERCPVCGALKEKFEEVA